MWYKNLDSGLTILSFNRFVTNHMFDRRTDRILITSSVVKIKYVLMLPSLHKLRVCQPKYCCRKSYLVHLNKLRQNRLVAGTLPQTH